MADILPQVVKDYLKFTFYAWPASKLVKKYGDEYTDELRKIVDEYEEEREELPEDKFGDESKLISKYAKKFETVEKKWAGKFREETKRERLKGKLKGIIGK